MNVVRRTCALALVVAALAACGIGRGRGGADEGRKLEMPSNALEFDSGGFRYRLELVRVRGRDRSVLDEAAAPAGKEYLVVGLRLTNAQGAAAPFPPGLDQAVRVAVRREGECAEPSIDRQFCVQASQVTVLTSGERFLAPGASVLMTLEALAAEGLEPADLYLFLKVEEGRLDPAGTQEAVITRGS